MIKNVSARRRKADLCRGMQLIYDGDELKHGAAHRDLVQLAEPTGIRQGLLIAVAPRCYLDRPKTLNIPPLHSLYPGSVIGKSTTLRIPGFDSRYDNIPPRAVAGDIRKFEIYQSSNSVKHYGRRGFPPLK
jgi:hypothetical protein